MFTIGASELKSLCQKRSDIAISMGQQRHGDALDEKFCIRFAMLLHSLSVNRPQIKNIRIRF